MADSNFTFRMPAKLREALEAEAAAEFRTLSATIIKELTDAMKTKGRLSK